MIPTRNESILLGHPVSVASPGFMFDLHMSSCGTHIDALPGCGLHCGDLGFVWRDRVGDGLIKVHSHGQGKM